MSLPLKIPSFFLLSFCLMNAAYGNDPLLPEERVALKYKTTGEILANTHNYTQIRKPGFIGLQSSLSDTEVISFVRQLFNIKFVRGERDFPTPDEFQNLELAIKKLSSEGSQLSSYTKVASHFGDPEVFKELQHKYGWKPDTTVLEELKKMRDSYFENLGGKNVEVTRSTTSMISTMRFGNETIKVPTPANQH